MRERNGSKHNKELVQRGSLTFLIDSKTFRNLKPFSKSTSAGRPQEFSNLLIQLLATIITHFKMTYRFLEGYSKSFLAKLIVGVELPIYSLICKRLIKIGASLPSLSLFRSSSVILDVTGMKVIGEGE